MIEVLKVSDPMLVQGAKWYVKLPENPLLREVMIVDVTPKTVSIKPLYLQAGAPPVRFAIEDVEFVEQPSTLVPAPKVVIA